MFLLPYALGPAVTAFSTRREGGVSQGPYASMNANPFCGDRPDHVRANLLRLSETLGLSPEQIVIPHQTHSTCVRFVSKNEPLEGVDALFTQTAGLCLCVSTADCIPVLLYDREHHAVAAIHAGWRGTMGRIVEKTIHAMNETLGTRGESLSAVVGPGISLEAFEVGDEVYEAFREAHFPMERIAKHWPERWHLDLWEANRLQLLACGLQPADIHMARICTYTRHEEFFSARRLGIHSGRILTGIARAATLPRRV